MILLKESDFSKKDIHKNIVLTLGVFDGVHIGHREIFDLLKSLTSDLDSKSLIITLSPDPEEVLYSDRRFTVISPLDYKIEILSQLGLDYSMVLKTDKELLGCSPREFFDKFIWERFRPKAIVVGEDFRFGRKREADVDGLRKLSSEYKFSLHIVPFLNYKGEKVSSSRIREALLRGEIEDVSYMLSRLPRFSGRVVPGEGRGRKLGFPTANIITDYVFDLKKGVYTGWALLKSKRLPALLYAGTAPTFGGKFLRFRSIFLDLEVISTGREWHLKFRTS
ncbi:MAG: riboflavin kinase [Candidatus Kaelpia imicola]|nr:riboflavin kinase [Candidatus Kaelpia imicola]